jgi:ATP-dependent DNA ligase
MLSRTRPPPAGFIEPCLPSPADRPPSGPGWIHEIKHDGYRLMVRRDAVGVRLLTRNGYDWSSRFPLISVEGCRCHGKVVRAGDVPDDAGAHSACCHVLLRPSLIVDTPELAL